jgi:hypothetical protein
MVLTACDFNHCSTIAPLNDGMLVAFYCGSGECRDDQKVIILFIKNKSVAYSLRLEDKTGNPVLWPINENQTIILYSKFEDNFPIKRIVDRWKYCSLWTRTITRTNNGFQVTQPQKVINRDHLLGRCAPIHHQDKLLLPLYDEINRCGVLYAIEGGETPDFKYISDLGDNMIQPTLWVNNNILFAMLRNFGNKQHFAFVVASTDGGENWSKPYITDIPNNNSSLHACGFNGQQYLLWNNTLNIYRYNMTLGVLRVIDGIAGAFPIKRVGDYGAYPYMIQHNKNLHFTFTNQDNHIEYHEWTKEAIKTAQKATEMEYRKYSID